MSSTTAPSEAQPETLHSGHHNTLHRIISNIDEQDAEQRYREEAADHAVRVPSHHRQAASLNSDSDTLVVAWEPKDPDNPYDWSPARKNAIVVAVVLIILNGTLASTLSSNAVPFIAKEWGITSDTQKILPLSIFLIGYIVGPLFWAPLSEQYGRRNLTIGTFITFAIWTMACALAPNWPAFLVFRLFVGVFASAPLSISAGIIADVYGEPRARGRAMALTMAATMFGPLFAPIIAGYCSESPSLGWRWTFWIGLMYAGVSLLILVFCLPETYGPVLLQWRAERLRQEGAAEEKPGACDVHGHHKTIVSPHELERPTWRELVVVVLTRPLRMVAFELIVTCTCVYLALVYSIFYMSFSTFPMIFQGIYGFSAGEEGLVFLAVGVGAVIAVPVFFAYDNFIDYAIAHRKAWIQQEEYRRLPLACLGGPLFVIGLFWLGWSARADVSFVVPMLSGVPFGMGYVLIFMSLLNYVADAYEIFAASAGAATSCFRAMLATVLPLATTPMFNRLSISGACSLLGGLSLLMSTIPFLFIWKGEKIREGSEFCRTLKERKAEMQRKIEEQRSHQQQGLFVSDNRQNGTKLVSVENTKEMV